MKSQLLNQQAQHVHGGILPTSGQSLINYSISLDLRSCHGVLLNRASSCRLILLHPTCARSILQDSIVHVVALPGTCRSEDVDDE